MHVVGADPMMHARATLSLCQTLVAVGGESQWIVDSPVRIDDIAPRHGNISKLGIVTSVNPSQRAH